MGQYQSDRTVYYTYPLDTPHPLVGVLHRGEGISVKNYANGCIANSFWIWLNRIDTDNIELVIHRNGWYSILFELADPSFIQKLVEFLTEPYKPTVYRIYA
jgi:hypothetical protein